MSGGGDIVTELKVWYENCPCFTKGLIYVCSASAILGLFTPIAAYLVNFPVFSIQYLQIWRLFLSSLAVMSILNLLFGFLVYLGLCARLERKWGTVKTIADFFWKTFFINIVYVLVMYLLDVLLRGATQIPTAGLWPIFFANLMEQAMENPDSITRLWCFPVTIKLKYYPIALWLIFSLFSGPRMDLLCAMIVGYVHFKYLNNRYHAYLNDRRMASWEGSFLFNWLTSFNNFAYTSVGATGAYGSNIMTSSQAQAQAQGQPQQPQPNRFKAFKGRGVTIGGTDEEAPAPAQNYNQGQAPTYYQGQAPAYNQEQAPTYYQGQAPAYVPNQQPAYVLPPAQPTYAYQGQQPAYAVQNQDTNYSQGPTDAYVPPDQDDSDSQILENNENKDNKVLLKDKNKEDQDNFYN